MNPWMWCIHGYAMVIKPPKAKGTENYQTRRNDGVWPVGDFDWSQSMECLSIWILSACVRGLRTHGLRTHGLQQMFQVSNQRGVQQIKHIEATPRRNQNGTQPMPFHAISKRKIIFQIRPWTLRKEPSKTCPTTYLTTSCSHWITNPTWWKKLGGRPTVNSPNRFCEGVLCGFCELALRSTAKQKSSKLCIDEKLEIDSGIGTGLQCIFQLYYTVAQLQRMQRGSMPRIRGKQQTKAAASGHNIRRSHGKLWKLNGSVLQITYFEWSPPTNILSDIYSNILSGILFGPAVPTEIWSSWLRWRRKAEGRRRREGGCTRDKI